MTGPTTGPSYDQPLPSRRELRRREAEAAAAGGGSAISYSDAPSGPAAPAPGPASPPGPEPAPPETVGSGAGPDPDRTQQFSVIDEAMASGGSSRGGAAEYRSAHAGSADSRSFDDQIAPDSRRRGGRDQGIRHRRHREREPLGPIRGTIRTFGELCITAGLVLILFVVWQLWWTDIAANNKNEAIANELTDDWANQEPIEDPNKLPDDPEEPIVAEPVPENTAFGIFYIPRFGDDYYRTLAEGVSLEPVLNRMGMGHYPNTGMPGSVGNFAIAGHRVTYGKPLNQIAELRPGDEIIVQTKDGFYTYTFRNFDIILPDAVEVLAPVPSAPEYKGKDRILTMTACNPMFSARERYVAYAELTEWTPRQDGPPDSIKDSKAYKKVSANGGS